MWRPVWDCGKSNFLWSRRSDQIRMNKMDKHDCSSASVSVCLNSARAPVTLLLVCPLLKSVSTNTDTIVFPPLLRTFYGLSSESDLTKTYKFPCLSFARCIKASTIHVPTRANMHVLMPPFKQRWNFLISWELLVLGHLCPDSWEQIYWSPAIKHLFNHEQMLLNHERSPQTFSLSFHWTVCSKPVLKVGSDSHNTALWSRDLPVN